MQARIDTYADTVEYATYNLFYNTVKNYYIVTLNANDSALPLLNKTKILEKVY